MSKTWQFSAGEIGFEYEPKPTEKAEFFLRNGSSDEILRLLMEVDAASRMRDQRPFVLYMPYVPYGRQDRVTAPGTAFSLQVFSKLINQQVFEQVYCIDPHSQVTWESINNLVCHQAWELMAHLPIHLLPCDPSQLVVVAPDKGAWTRAGQCATALGARKTLTATKHRDPVTGRIEGIELDGELLPTDHVLVVDDICDGGGTFIVLHELIHRKCATMSLFVTHGIFSKGYQLLEGLYHTVITTDSFTPPSHWDPKYANDRPPAENIIPLRNIFPNWT